MTALVGPDVVHPDATGATSGVRERRRDRLVHLSGAVGILLVSRAVMAAVLGLVHRFTHLPPLETSSWDGGWYIQAARGGWPHTLGIVGGQASSSTLAFFPGFPELIRIAHAVTGVGWTASAAAAALVAQVFMVLAIWLLADDVWDTAAADRAVLLVCFFPGAFILALLYSEPLMIGFGAVCLLSLRRQWWVVAGVSAALATATRPNAVALVAACAWAAAVAVHQRREWRALVAVALAPIGIVGWFTYLWASTGAKLAWFRAEEGGWGERIQPTAVVHLVRSLAHDGLFTYPNEYVVVCSTLGALALMVLLVRSRVPTTWVVYTAVVLVMALMSKTLGLRPRFVITAFPLVMVLGARLGPSKLGVFVAASSGLMIGLVVLVTTGLSMTP